MDRTLLQLAAVGALGLYLLLPRSGKSAMAVRIGAGLGIGSLLLLITLLGVPSPQLPPSAADGAESTPVESSEVPPDDGTASTVLLWTLAASSVVAATLVITRRRLSDSLGWFCVMLAANTAVLLWHGAEWIAAANGLLYLAVLGTLWTVNEIPVASPSPNRLTREPALACALGALVVVGLGGTLYQTYHVGPALRLQAERSDADAIEDARTNVARFANETTAGLADEVFSQRPVALASTFILMIGAAAGSVQVMRIAAKKEAAR